MDREYIDRNKDVAAIKRRWIVLFVIGATIAANVHVLWMIAWGIFCLVAWCIEMLALAFKEIGEMEQEGY